jgi:hypothetical protein
MMISLRFMAVSLVEEMSGKYNVLLTAKLSQHLFSPGYEAEGLGGGKCYDLHQGFPTFFEWRHT